MITSLMPVPKQQYFAIAGIPLVGGKVYTYAAGTTNPKATYTNFDGSEEQTNPIILNARGEPPKAIFWSGNYRVDVRDAIGNLIYTVDNYNTDPGQILDLFGDGGAGKIGYGSDTVAGALDALRMTNYAALRDYGGPQSSAYITGYLVAKSPSGIAGFFTRDDSDTTSTDNGGWCIVDAKGRRWKRPNYMTVNPLWFGAIDDFTGAPGTSTDNAAAISAAIASFPAQGSPNWRPWALELSATGAGRGYYVGSTINIKNQQFGRLIGKSATLVGNFNGVVLQLGDTGGTNDMLWFHLDGLNVQQMATGANAVAVQMQHAYACSVRDCYFYGGQFAFVLDGNANQISNCTFRAGITANVTCAATANNEANSFLDCSNELSQGYGYDLNVSSGTGGFTRILGGYCERNGLANIRAKNSQNFMIDGVYFNLQNGAPAILLDGTVGPTYPNGYGVVQNCRILGPDSGTPAKFIQEVSTAAINCAYRRNEVEPGTLVNLYGAAGQSINLDRRRKLIYMRNAIDFTDANTDGVPDNWTRQGSGAVTTSASVSAYGVGSSVNITPTNAYIYQDITFPANSLLRISGWVKTTGADARIELWTSALTGAYATGQATGATPVRVEFYVATSQVLPGVNSAKLLLRTRDGGTASFSDIEIEDMTN